MQWAAGCLCTLEHGGVSMAWPSSFLLLLWLLLKTKGLVLVLRIWSRVAMLLSVHNLSAFMPRTCSPFAPSTCYVLCVTKVKVVACSIGREPSTPKAQASKPGQIQNRAHSNDPAVLLTMGFLNGHK